MGIVQKIAAAVTLMCCAGRNDTQEEAIRKNEIQGTSAKITAKMPVTVRSATHPPREYQWGYRASAADSSADLFTKSCPTHADKNKGIIQSSFGKEFFESKTDDAKQQHKIIPSTHGFVYAAIDAYSSHHHLAIRPEDVWFAILVQFSFYVNAHAEELRKYFVAHEGKKDVVVTAAGTRFTVDLGWLATEMTHEMEKHIIDKDLRTWIIPDFTTTTQTDLATAAILMMGAMQKYFSYEMCLTCGIPSITLLGEREDWVKIRKRLDKIPTFGKEPERWSVLLTSVLDYFIKTFDDPNAPDVKDFWAKIAHEDSMGSGPDYLRGWITAFSFWDEEGNCLNRKQGSTATQGEGAKSLSEFDASIFHQVDMSKIPVGHVSVPVKLNDNGEVFKTNMVAGSVAIKLTSSGEKLDESQTHDNSRSFRFDPITGQKTFNKNKPKVGNKTGLDSLQPITGWWMYEIKEEASS